ncbi:Protein CBG22908 [Caenorhabditis briggsae]|uniref:Protein CBG22908 n=1 Tax=Caenorhabditis briggsae TaxID=6238 RepID=A8Y3C2_CAEBR|nr:Protein CBG22908 [Caenorhabditis briggsae]CAP39391.1 Protein CBG22908 [Caenorhabditis briggsae]
MRSGATNSAINRFDRAEGALSSCLKRRRRGKQAGNKIYGLVFELLKLTVTFEIQETFHFKMNVRGLTIQTAHRKEIMKVLPFLDSEFLKELYIFTTPDDKNKVLEMDEILKLDHLNNLESFEISGCIVPDNCVIKLAHVPYNDIRVDSINSKDMLFLKDENFRQRSNNSSFFLFAHFRCSFLYFSIIYIIFLFRTNHKKIIEHLQVQKEIFEILEIQNFHFTMNSPRNSSISDMPELILCKIFGFLDFREIQTIRKVSKSLRNFIDDVRPDSKILEISIEENSENENLEIKYKTKFQTFLVKYEISENLKRAISDLNLIMKNQKSVLETFILKNLSNFRCSEILKTHKILTIEELVMETENQEEILEILTFYKISKLHIFSLEEFPKNLKIENLVELENWKNLEEISIEGCQISKKYLEHFLNFSKFSIDLEDVEAEDLIYLKENLLESSKFQKFTLFYTKLLNIQQLYDTFGPPDLDPNFYGLNLLESSKFYKFTLFYTKLLDIQQLYDTFGPPDLDPNFYVFVKHWKFPFPEDSDFLKKKSIMEFEMPKIMFNRCSEQSEFPVLKKFRNSEIRKNKKLKNQKIRNSEIQKFRNSEIQKFRNSEIQKFGNSEIQKFRNSEIQKFRNSEVQKFRNSEIQKFRNSEIQKFRNSEIQKFRNSEIRKFRNSEIQKYSEKFIEHFTGGVLGTHHLDMFPSFHVLLGQFYHYKLPNCSGNTFSYGPGARRLLSRDTFVNIYY